MNRIWGYFYFLVAFGLFTELTLAEASSGASMIPMSPTQPFRINFDPKLRPEERDARNSRYHPTCRLNVVSTPAGFKFALWFNLDLVFTSANLGEVLEKVRVAQNKEKCFNEDIAPRCRIEEINENGTSRYRISLDRDPITSVESLDEAFLLSDQIGELKLCDYGEEYFAPPRNSSRRPGIQEGSKSLPLLESLKP